MGSFTQFDGELLISLQHALYADWLTPVMQVITSLSECGAIEILLCLVLLICRRTRRLGIICTASLAFTFLCCNLVIKPLVDRPRPWELFDAVNVMMRDPGDASFPSGHTANAMGTAFAVFLASRPRDRSYEQVPCLGWRGAGADPRIVYRWGIFAVIMALLTGLSRLYLGMHFPSDVVFGSMLGMACALIIHIVFKKIEAERGIIGSTGSQDHSQNLG